MVREAPIEKLTPREEEVLDLLRRGLTNDQIAQRLNISADGAKYHVSEIITKLGVRNRYEAAAWPQRPPWWSPALVPIAFPWRRLTAGWLARGATALLTVAVAAGVGVLIWGLVRTYGGDGGSGSAPTGQAATPVAFVDVGGTIASISDQQLVVRDLVGNLVNIRLEHAEGPEAQFCRHALPLDYCMVLSEAAPTKGQDVCVMAHLMPGGDLLAWFVQLDSQCRFVPVTPPATPP